MENKLISIIYDLIKDKNLYNYDNDNQLISDNVEIEEDYLWDEKVIRIKLLNEEKEYMLRCGMTWCGNPHKEEV